MKKAINILFLFLVLLLTIGGCGRRQQAAQQQQSEVSTPIDSDISSINNENNDLNESELNGIDNDLGAIGNV